MSLTTFLKFLSLAKTHIPQWSFSCGYFVLQTSETGVLLFSIRLESLHSTYCSVGRIISSNI